MLTVDWQPAIRRPFFRRKNRMPHRGLVIGEDNNSVMAEFLQCYILYFHSDFRVAS